MKDKTFTTRFDRKHQPIYEGDYLEYYRDGNIKSYRPPKLVKWVQNRQHTGWNIGDCKNYQIVKGKE